MGGIHLFDNGPREDVIFSRPLYRQVLDQLAPAVDGDITIGVSRGDEDLFDGLATRGARLLVSDYPNSVHGAPVDLAHLAPPSATPIGTWIRTYEDKPTYQWEDVLTTFERQVAEAGLDLRLAGDPAVPPMFEFADPEAPPVLRRPTVYLDNVRTSSRDVYFVFDIERLADTFRDWDFAHTGPVACERDNLIDVSHLPVAALSALSERCSAVLGSARGRFAWTLTEANRFKKKAACGYDGRITPLFWDYPHNPLEYLLSMDAVVDFLNTALREEVA